MSKGRLEAFSDGVLAIIITIMVLELKPPQDATIEGIQPVVRSLLGYLLSFVFVAIYWNNHHHLLQAAERVSGRVLWANMHLLFWLSLVPLVTNWVAVAQLTPLPVAAYGVVLLLSGCAYYILSRALIADHGQESALALAVGRDKKGVVSVLIYSVAIPMAFVDPRISCGLYVVVAIMWLVPDRRIEMVLAGRDNSSSSDE